MPHPAATSAKHQQCHNVFIGFRQVSVGIQKPASRLLGHGGSGNCRTSAQSSDPQSMTLSNNLGQFLSGLVWCNNAMATGQLWLFPPPRPLVERFGDEFFHALPAAPGVYLLCGESEGVLYVGKARNLRKRLSSYRVANPERLPRRIVRLLFRVRRIEFDVCATEVEAVEREAALICVLQPRFNRAGQVWPRPAKVSKPDSA
jgi:hypothetical protein